MFKLSEEEERENDYERLRRKFNFRNINFKKNKNPNEAFQQNENYNPIKYGNNNNLNANNAVYNNYSSQMNKEDVLISNAGKINETNHPTQNNYRNYYSQSHNLHQKEQKDVRQNPQQKSHSNNSNYFVNNNNSKGQIIKQIISISELKTSTERVDLGINHDNNYGEDFYEAVNNISDSNSFYANKNKINQMSGQGSQVANYGDRRINEQFKNANVTNHNSNQGQKIYQGSHQDKDKDNISEMDKSNYNNVEEGK